MGCIHKCLGCTRQYPQPEQSIMINGVAYRSVLPSCHPGVDQHGFTKGSPTGNESLLEEKGVESPPEN